MTEFPNLVGKIAADLSIAKQVITELSALPIVSIFGSARVPEGTPMYDAVKTLAAAISGAGYIVCTGGGPGIMEAVSRGAYETGGQTLGLSIKLPFEAKSNDYLTRNVTFQNFAQRKVVFCAASSAYIAAPGGFGTMDELFEVLTLMQCQILKEAPVILFGVEFWTPLMAFMEGQMLSNKMITQADLDKIVVTDDIQDIVSLITGHTITA